MPSRDLFGVRFFFCGGFLLFLRIFLAGFPEGKVHWGGEGKNMSREDKPPRCMADSTRREQLFDYFSSRASQAFWSCIEMTEAALYPVTVTRHSRIVAVVVDFARTGDGCEVLSWQTRTPF